jgi:hypothetical protein
MSISLQWAGLQTKKNLRNTIHACPPLSRPYPNHCNSVVYTQDASRVSCTLEVLYVEGFMSLRSAEKKIRKPDLTVDSAGETRKRKKKDGTVVANPGIFISPMRNLANHHYQCSK